MKGELRRCMEGMKLGCCTRSARRGDFGQSLAVLLAGGEPGYGDRAGLESLISG